MHLKTKTPDTSKTKFGSLILNSRTYLKSCKKVSNIHNFTITIKGIKNVISTKPAKQNKFRLYN